MDSDVPALTNMTMAIGGALVALACLFSRVGARWGIPVSVLFLAVGMLAGVDGPGGIEFREFSLAYIVGTVALAAVLFAGGLQTPVRSLRDAIGPAAVLATAGVLGIAALTAVVAHAIGLPWDEAWLVGAIVSSTDASSVFTVLHGVKLPRRVAHTIELESGLNDPVAVILTLVMTSRLLGKDVGLAEIAGDIGSELAIGGVCGVALGLLGHVTLRYFAMCNPALNPVLTLGFALAAFGVPAALGGSGFLAVYLAGMIVGNSNLPQREHLVHVHDSLSWLAQVGMFLLLGLLVNPSELSSVAVTGTTIALALAFIVRPAVVLACLTPFRFSWREKLFIAWVGLRGAVPIVMATLPVLAVKGQSAQTTEALCVFDIVFFVVIVSALIPGATVQRAARWLDSSSSGDAEPVGELSDGASPPLSGWGRFWKRPALQ
jgi:cell volume regulation protein A